MDFEFSKFANSDNNTDIKEEPKVAEQENTAAENVEPAAEQNSAEETPAEESSKSKSKKKVKFDLSGINLSNAKARARAQESVKNAQTRLNYEVQQAKMARDKAHEAQSAISKQQIAGAAMGIPQAVGGQATLPTTTQGFGRTA